MLRCQFSKGCSNPAVVQSPYTKRGFCREHFLLDIENRVGNTLKDYNLIDFEDPKEKILVALSGGKDSQTLLNILDQVVKKRIPIEALYIEVGISPKNYSKDSGKVARELCDQLNIPFHTIDIRESLGFTIDDIHALGTKWNGRSTRGRKGRKKQRFRGECSYCGLIKRYYINYFAVHNGFTKVATGHNLTDEATQLVSNFFVGDIELMGRAGPSTARNVKGLVDRIKPLYYIYESELILYAFHRNINHLSTQCVYAVDSPMIQVKKSLEEVESFRRGMMMRMVRDFQNKLRPVFYDQIPNEKQTINQCEKCSMTTYMEKCSFCRTTERLKDQFIQYHIHPSP